MQLALKLRSCCPVSRAPVCEKAEAMHVSASSSCSHTSRDSAIPQRLRRFDINFASSSTSMSFWSPLKFGGSFLQRFTSPHGTCSKWWRMRAVVPENGCKHPMQRTCERSRAAQARFRHTGAYATQQSRGAIERHWRARQASHATCAQFPALLPVGHCCPSTHPSRIRHLVFVDDPPIFRLVL